jgi:hypothetical protein
MTMLAYVFSSAVVGVPVSLPVVLLKLAHTGLFAIVKLSVLPSGSLADGENVYAWPATTLVAGVPLMTGGLLAGAGAAVTLMLKGPMEVLALPSETEIVIPE